MMEFAPLGTWNRWKGQGNTQRPSFFEPAPKGSFRYANSFSPFYCCECNTFIGNNSIVGAITSLFCKRSPTAVIWSVMTVIVNAVKLVLRRWSFTHVSKKSGKIQPRVTDSDTSTTISAIRGSFGIEASGFHGTPDIKFWRIGTAMSQSIAFSHVTNFFHMLFGSFLVQATTGFNVAVSQITKAYSSFISTFTQTTHNAFSMGISTYHSFNSKTIYSKTNELFISNAIHCLLGYHKTLSNATK